MTNQTPANPAQKFALTVQGLANSFLSQITDPEQVQKAAGRLALALRKVATTNKAIYECSPESVAHCVAMSALTGLMPGGVKPDVYLIPRKGSLEWQVSVRGLQTLATMNGWQSVTARPVHVDDVYEVIGGDEERIVHKPCRRWPASPAELAGMYVVATPHVGPVVRVDVPLGVIEARRKKAQTDAIWRDWFVEMAQKTAIGWVISRGYLGSLERSPEMQAISEYETPHREATPARITPRPAAIEYEADASAEVLDALEMEQ
jgi:recombinational DNA repair protein RecT